MLGFSAKGFFPNVSFQLLLPKTLPKGPIFRISGTQECEEGVGSEGDQFHLEKKWKKWSKNCPTG